MEWTNVDQARIDAFEQQMLNVAKQLKGGNPDVIVLGFAQTLGSLMRQRLHEDPTRLALYIRALEMVRDYVNQSVLPDREAN